MTRATILAGTFVILLVLTTGCRNHTQDVDTAIATAPTNTQPAAPLEPAAYQGFLYGRITSTDGTVYEGRLRWGGDEEAFWGDYFNGFKDENPWIARVPPGQLDQPRTVKIFGLEIDYGERQIDLGRPFMQRFGDITRIDLHGRDIRVTLKGGSMSTLDRFSADDLADGVRVWDDNRGVVDIDERRIRTVELLPTARLAVVPDRLYGTVRTRDGDFTGFVQWDREEGVGTDELDGYSGGDVVGVRFDSISSIARQSRDSTLVTLRDGRDIILTGTREVDHRNRGIYVDDMRYGRVLISWDAFERVRFGPGGAGPAYGDFPPGQPLIGTVTTSMGRRFTGRLVFDLDESETTETLDAPSQGVDYTIAFGLIASVLPHGGEEGSERPARVFLHSGEELQFERTGDLGERNAGLLIFVDDNAQPEYVRWPDVARIDFDRPLAMYPPLGEH